MQHIKGNLLDSDCKVIIHGCNAQGRMGAGVAKEVKKRYKTCFHSYVSFLVKYRSCCRDEREYENTIVGRSFMWWNSTNDKCVENLISQFNYGNDGKMYASLPGIVKGLKTIIEYHSTQKQFAIPKIGCGFGGLQWSSVEPYLKGLEKHYGIEFLVYEL